MSVFTKKVSEKWIEDELKKQLKKLFPLMHLYLKFKAIMFNGVPDRLLLLPGGRIYFVELKKPKGGVISPVQRTVHAIFKRLGFPVYLIFTVEDLNNFLIEIAL